MATIPPRVNFVHPLPPARDYQDRREFADLCGWWEEGGAGVCTLIGMGGAGKTALTEHFLRVIPQVLRDDTRLPKRPGLPIPSGVFVFSFYKNPVESLWKDLYAWCVSDFQSRDERSRDESGNLLPPTSHQVMDVLRLVPGPLLLVLDGLERIQDNGGQGREFGRLQDAGMRDLILRAAESLLPISVLVTSRFPLFDLRRSRFHKEIEVKTLMPQAAVALLRARGVQGGDYDLEALAREQGFHALTVDLLGGYIGVFCQGDPTLLPPVPSHHLVEEVSSGDPQHDEILEQARRFARVAARYRETLEKEDPVCLAVLRRICYFRLGLSAERLTTLFLGEGKEGLSGLELSRLPPEKLGDKLNWLANMRLVEVVDRPEGRSYTVHPAVRDGFLEGIGIGEMRASHHLARQSLEAILGGRPGERFPSDSATLGFLEELVYHAIESDEFEDAWDIYFNRLGGFKNLGWRLGEFHRGESICRAFAFRRPPESAPLPKSFSASVQAQFLNDWACYLLRLGRLIAAAKCYQRMMEIPVRLVHFFNASIARSNLAGVHLLAGRLQKGIKFIDEALDYAVRVEDERERAWCLSYRGYVRYLAGQIVEAGQDFDEALRWQRRDSQPDRQLFGRRGIWRAEFLADTGRLEEAITLTRANETISVEEAVELGDNPWRCALLLANLLLRKGDLVEAEERLNHLESRLRALEAKESLCSWLLISARLHLARVSYAESKEKEDLQDRVSQAVEEGLGIAAESGYGVLYLELLLLRARLHLLRGDFTKARTDAEAVLGGNDFVSGVAGAAPAALLEGSIEHFSVLAATDPECGLRGIEADARYFLAEALLMESVHAARLITPRLRLREQVAKAIHWIFRYEVKPRRLYRWPAQAEGLLDRGRTQMELSRSLRRSLRSPRLWKVEARLAEIAKGKLSHFPSQAVPVPVSRPSDSREGAEIDVFISYKRRDKKLAVKIAAALRDRGLKVWLDVWKLKPGRLWQQGIEEAIAQARAVALLVGPEGVDGWMRREISASLEQEVARGIPVIPVILRGGSVESLPGFARSYQAFDMSQGMKAEMLENLVQALREPAPPRERILTVHKS